MLSLALATTLAACGSDDSSSGADGFDAVTISGQPSKAPEVTWKSELAPGDVQTKVLKKGDGAEVQKGDQVQANLWIGDGADKKAVYSTWDKSQGPQVLTIGSNLGDALNAAFEGQTVGSRVAVTSSATDAFGEGGNPTIGIGNEDGVLIIVDILKRIQVLDGPQGSQKAAPSWAPKVVQKGDTVTGLDFKGTPKPDGKLRAAALIQGNGEKVKKGQTITVNYLGEVYGATKPFDESYSKSPAQFPIGVGQVVPGWDKTLVGTRVGSRLILAIPPKDGYGTQGNAQAGIKGTDTLYFVVDVLSAA